MKAIYILHTVWLRGIVNFCIATGYITMNKTFWTQSI